MKKTKLWLAITMTAALTATSLAGCGSTGTSTSASTAASAETTESAKAASSASSGTSDSSEKPADAADEQVVKSMYSEEISDWNPLHPSSGTTWANWIDTLVEYDNYGMCQPCLAESWEQSDDGLTWTFHIRKGVH